MQSGITGKDVTVLIFRNYYIINNMEIDTAVFYILCLLTHSGDMTLPAFISLFQGVSLKRRSEESVAVTW